MSTKKTSVTKKSSNSAKTEGSPATKPAAPRRSQKALRWQDPHLERERAKYGEAMPSREFILQLVTESAGPVDSEEFAVRLGIEPDEMDAFTVRLRAMQRDGQIVINRRGALCLPDKIDVKNGHVEGHQDGFGFFVPDDKSGDMFIHEKEMRGVLHGDRVMVREHGVDRRGRKEGKIVEVLERVNQTLVGRLYRERGYQWVVAENRRISQDILIPDHADLGASNGQVVMTEIVEQPTKHAPPVGRVTKILGSYADPGMEIEIALRKHSLPHDFPPDVLAVAKKLPKGVLKKDLGGGREDIRDLPLVTIDGEDARDFDDAVWCQPNRNGFRLVVAIADVSHYVQPESPLDDEAQLRATSVYFPGFVIPMLPETLSNGICSLRPNEDRLAFVCDMQVDHEGEVTRAKFHEAVIRSHARLTYTQVWRAIGEDDAQARAELGPLLPQIEHLHQLYRVLAKARAARGAIEFETGEVHFILGPDGEVVQGGMSERNDAHKLIEECMIAANVQAARYLLKKAIPAPYRVHDRPPEQKYAELEEFLAEFQLRMPPWSKVQPRDFTQLLKKVRKRADAALIESVLLRSQSLAVYAPQNIGHFGLALDAYAHFTSPIRRYPDVLVHRAIKHALAGGHPNDYRYGPHDMAQLCLQCSERGRRAEEAEREVDERYRAAWMEQHVGSQFDGIVSGVTSFGLFVEMSESKVTGLVHVTQLPKDWYQFDPVRRVLSGERSGAAWRQGDAVRVLVLRASVEDKRIDLRLVSNEAAGKTRATRTRWA